MYDDMSGYENVTLFRFTAVMILSMLWTVKYREVQRGLFQVIEPICAYSYVAMITETMATFRRYLGTVPTAKATDDSSGQDTNALPTDHKTCIAYAVHF